MNAYILRRRKLGKTSCRAISQFSNKEIPVVLNGRDCEIETNVLCIRWGCTALVPQKNVLNTSKSIHLVSCKVEFRKILNNNNLCPKTWFTLESIPDVYPIIVRPQTHSQGRRLYYCNTILEIQEAINLCGDNWYASEFIDKVEEYRVFCMQGRVLCVAKKTPGNPNDIAWNVARGGRFDNVKWNDWNLKAIRIALEGFMLSELDFGGVDIIVDEENNCYILEINSAPSLTSSYRQECFAKGIDYIIDNNKSVIPLVNKKSNYKKFIHPAICSGALLID